MCVYVEQDHQAEWHTAFQWPIWQTLVDQVLSSSTPGHDGIARCRPAFGHNTDARLFGVIAADPTNGLRVVSPIWWFDCTWRDNQVQFGHRHSYNARNLDLPLWSKAIQSQRCLIPATGIGESKIIDGKKHYYRMVSKTPFLLGGLIKTLDNGQTCAAIITRDPHVRFSRYHDKAFPLFMPEQVIDTWLAPEINDQVTALLTHPLLTTDLIVTHVKSFQSAQAIGQPTPLPMDLIKH